MNTHSNSPENKHWVLLDHIPIPHSKKILLLVFLYSLAFTLLLVGLKIFCRNLSANTTDSLSGNPEESLSENLPEQAAPAIAMATPMSSNDAASIQKDIAENIIRLHVIANSDSEADQALKLKVRDEILSGIQDSLIYADTPAIAGKILKKEKEMIAEIAAAKIRQEGYDYSVCVVLEKRYFPAKSYGDLTFPPGNYQALCVEIGAAAGKNWWCVLFPSLCFVDETNAVIPEESKTKLQDSLSPEAYESLENHAAAPSASPGAESDKVSPSLEPEFRSAIADAVKNWIRQKR